MNKYIGYGLFFIILIPVAFLLGIGILFSLLQAFANPVLLFPLFMLSSFVVYTIASLVFYNKAVRQKRTCKASLRDLIRINAFIIMIPAVLFIWQGLNIASNPGSINELIKQVKTVQSTMVVVSDVVLAKLIRGIYYFMVTYAIVILLHIIYTFRLLKQYKPLFLP